MDKTLTITTIEQRDGELHLTFADGRGIVFPSLDCLRREILAYRIAPIHLVCEMLDDYLKTDPDLKDMKALQLALQGTTGILPSLTLTTKVS